MRTWILTAGVVAAAASATTTRASAQTAAAPPQIITTGSGEARVSPDRATIFIGVQSRATTAAAAGIDNARRQRAILDTLRALGLTGDELSTINYSVSPEMQYSPNGQIPPRVTGYTVTNTVRAEVRKLDDVGRLIDAALAKGANQISSLQFYSSKADSARRAALAAAVVNARADAETLARAAGGALGPLLELQTSSFQMPRTEMAMARMTADAFAPTPIEPGQQAVTTTVSARWTFLPQR